MSLNVFPSKQGEPDQNTKGAPISISPSSSSLCDNYGLNSLRSHDTSWNRGWIGLKFVNYKKNTMTCSWSPSKVPGGRWELVHCTRCRVGGVQGGSCSIALVTLFYSDALPCFALLVLTSFLFSLLYFSTLLLLCLPLYLALLCSLAFLCSLFFSSLLVLFLLSSCFSFLAHICPHISPKTAPLFIYVPIDALHFLCTLIYIHSYCLCIV